MEKRTNSPIKEGGLIISPHVYFPTVEEYSQRLVTLIQHYSKKENTQHLVSFVYFLASFAPCSVEDKNNLSLTTCNIRKLAADIVTVSAKETAKILQHLGVSFSTCLCDNIESWWNIKFIHTNLLENKGIYLHNIYPVKPT